MRIALTLALWTLASVLALAQDCTVTLRGQVTDEHDGQPLEFSAVYLLGAAIGTYTDADGFYALEVPCGGRDTVRVTHIGCAPALIPIDLIAAIPGEAGVAQGAAFPSASSGQAAKTLDVTLEHHTELLESVTVHAHRSETSAADIGSTLSGDQLDRTAGADLAEVVERLPGVRTLANGANVGRPLVDGLGGARLMIVEGGTVLASQDWGDEHAPEIDPFAAAAVQLARSGGTLRYGAATTGATLVIDDPGRPTTREPKGQALLLGASNARTYGGGAAVGQALGPRWSYRAQAFGSSAGDARAPDYVLSNTGARRGSGQARIYYADSAFSAQLGYRAFYQEAGILRAAHIGNLSDFERAIASGQPLVVRDYTRAIDAPRLRATHHWLSGNLGYRFADETQLRLNYSTQVNLREEYDLRRGGRSARPSLDMRLTTHDLRLELTPTPGERWRGNYGVEVVSAANRNLPGTGVRPFVPYYDVTTYGLFAERTNVGERLSWSFGARGDLRRTDAVYFDETTDGGGQRARVDFGRQEFVGTASAGLVHYGSGGSSIRGRLVYASRTPNPAERFADGVHHALAIIERGDTSLQVERGVKGSLGFGLEPKPGLGLHVTAFAQGFQNFIYAQQQALPELTIRGAFPVLAYRQADALLAGVDLDAHLPLGPVQLDAEFSYLYGRQRGGVALPDVAPYRVRTELSYSSSLGKRLKDYRLAATGSYTGRQSQVPPTLLAPAPGDYFLLGFDLSGHFALGEEVLGVHLTAYNLLNTRYRDYLDRLRFYADRPGRDVQFRLLYDF